MAANFEVYIVSSEYINFEQVGTLFSHAGMVRFENAIMVSNDFYFNRSELVSKEISEDTKAIISAGKIVQYQGKVGENIFGLRQYQEGKCFCQNCG